MNTSVAIPPRKNKTAVVFAFPPSLTLLLLRLRLRLLLLLLLGVCVFATGDGFDHHPLGPGRQLLRQLRRAYAG